MLHRLLPMKPAPPSRQSATGLHRGQAAGTIPVMQVPIEWLPAQGPAEQLILLLHGWGLSGANMAPLAQALRLQFP